MGKVEIRGYKWRMRIGKENRAHCKEKRVGVEKMEIRGKERSMRLGIENRGLE